MKRDPRKKANRRTIDHLMSMVKEFEQTYTGPFFLVSRLSEPKCGRDPCEFADQCDLVGSSQAIPEIWRALEYYKPEFDDQRGPWLFEFST